MGHWLKFRAPKEGGPVSISGQGSGLHMPQLKHLNAATKDPAC